MCGIAGMVYTDGREVESATIHTMCESMVHRGPDDEGIFVSAGVGLGMRRLSVIDLSGGHQPMCNEDSSIWIVFNGEIYNFPEIRAELEARGHRLRSHSDSEVIVHLYEDMGRDCVQKLRGMFAFAIYDQRQRCLLLARDRLGKKPMHYALGNGQFFFASEIKAILAVAPELAVPNNEALLEYFYFGYVPDPVTAFTPIQKLAPGHTLEFRENEIRICQYWDLPRYGTYRPISEQACLEELEQRLTEAVRIRLISDVPLGALLSGGTDSSTVVALMAQLSSRPVQTFSIGFGHADFDEIPYARLVAQRFQTDHHELRLEPDVANTVEQMSGHLEEPFGDSSMLPTYFISRLARQHVTVALSGDGGDEAFAGYDRYRIHLRERSHDWIPRWAGRWYRRQLHPRIPYRVPGRSLAYSISLPWEERYTEGISLHAFQREMSILSEDFVISAQARGTPLALFRALLEKAPAHDPLGRVLYLDTKTYLPGDILTKVDRMSMATSLEMRSPLLDHLFLEWVTGLPGEWKMRGGEQKYLLRKLAERVGVPRQVLDRPKQGFALPLVHWIRHELRDMILTVLLEARTLQRGYFHPAGVRRLLEEHFRGRRDHSARIWRLLMFELWQRNFLQRVPLGRPQIVLDHAASLSGER